MSYMDIFNAAPFTAVEMTKAVDRLSYVPGFMQSLGGLYQSVAVTTEDIFIETGADVAALIKVTPRGAPPEQMGGRLRTVKGFRTVRTAIESRITAAELRDVLMLQVEGVPRFKMLADELLDRAMRLKRRIVLTKEYMLLGMVQGKAVGLDESRQPKTFYTWADEFGQVEPAEVGFDLSNANPGSGAVWDRCDDVVRTITKNLGGFATPGVRIVGLAGDGFYKKLRAHKEVQATYLNYSDARELRSTYGAAWSSISYGNIDFINYRGTDDGSTVAIASDKVRFFPLGADIFQWVMSPGERFEHLGQRGQEFYSYVDVDRNDTWVDLFVASYPLPVCIQPSAVMGGRAGA